jgi:DNA invertase Pin-like site-specific DNA recombinase
MASAFAYIRTSSAANLGDDKDSVTRQRTAIERYAEAADFTIKEEYQDPAVSGESDITERPGFAAMLDAIEGNGVRTVIVEDASRFARSTLTAELGILLLRQRGVKLVTASGDDLTDDSDEMREAMRKVAGAFAEAEKKRLVKKLRAARDRKSAAQGKRVEGRKGYRETNPELVRQAKRLRRKSPKTGERRSLRQVSEELAKLGYTTRSGRQLPAEQVKRLLT